MIDKWFLDEVESQIKLRSRIVILDPTAQCAFLLPLLNDRGYVIIKTDSANTEQWRTVKEELLMRQTAEDKHKNDNVIFYVTREQSKLSFLFDYCFTHGCVNLSNPIEWLKKKLFANTGLQVQKDSQTLMTAAKLSIGKDISWWKKILQNLEELIDLDDDLLLFMHEPENYLNSLDPDIRRLLEEKLFELLGQPYITKPPKTIANEIAKMMFDGLAHNVIKASLLELYFKWADSDTYRPSLINYISDYKIDLDVTSWAANFNHCFEELDRKALQALTSNLRNKSFISEKLYKIKERVNSNKIKFFVPSWWQDIFILLEFDTKSLTACDDFNKVIKFYINNFSKLDRAIRNLYSNFLHEKDVIRPLQEHYESLNNELLQQWYAYSNQYKPYQQGYLEQLLKDSKPGIAVIVGDGIRYEIANAIAVDLEKKFKVEKNTMLADMPSETENNMSALYLGKNVIQPIHKERENYLSETTGKNITFINLEALNYGEKADYLLLNYKDIDSAGEKFQQGAIKLFAEFEQVLKDKIVLLLNMGYNEVHLLTDHGFVLTGLLDESDKIEPDAIGKKEVHERFIRTVDKQTNKDWIGFEKSYGEFKYVYASKSHRPFKSKGVYGFSHGGFTPQEIVLPNFIFQKFKAAEAGLEVSIKNKSDLAEVVGNLFGITLQSSSKDADLFSSKRKVQILLYSGNTKYSSSNIITMELDKTETFEFSFNNNSEIKAVLLDAETQEQLDVIVIKKSNVRDLGGL